MRGRGRKRDGKRRMKALLDAEKEDRKNERQAGCCKDAGESSFKAISTNGEKRAASAAARRG